MRTVVTVAPPRLSWCRDLTAEELSRLKLLLWRVGKALGHEAMREFVRKHTRPHLTFDAIAADEAAALERDLQQALDASGINVADPGPVRGTGTQPEQAPPAIDDLIAHRGGGRMNATFTAAVAADNPAVRRKLAKIVAVADGRVINVRPAPKAFRHKFAHVEIRDLDHGLAAIQEIAEIGGFITRGAPKAEFGRRATHDSEKGEAGIVDVPQAFAVFDFDSIPIQPADEAGSLPDPLLDPDVGVGQAIRVLPPEFRVAACIWQITASAGYKPGWRLRTFHILDKPVISSKLKMWVRPARDLGLLDDCTLTPSQPIYVSMIVLGGPDPCPQRFGIWRPTPRADEAVHVPDLDAMERRLAEHARREREKNRAARTTLFHAASSGGVHNTALGNACTCYLCECVRRVARAATGARHPTYLREAARVRAVVDKYSRGDWDYWREELMAAYETTLTQQEASERKKSSTHGVMAWLDERQS